MTNLYQRLSKERKEKQAAGEYPQWFTSPSYQIFKEKYLYEAESFKEQATRIAATAAKHTKAPKVWEEKFFEVIWNGWLSCATPVLSNMGTNRGLPVSCSGQYIHDSIDGFYKNRHETALMTKYGFGTSGYLGDIRPRGSEISVGGKASGVLPVIKGFVQDMREVSQGGVRRGSWAGSLPIAHGDFYEVCDYLKDHPDDLNLAWLIYQSDLDALEAGDEDMIARFKKVMKTKMLTGKGYFTFPDKANDLNPESYLKNGLEFKASNLCQEIILHSDEEHSYTCQPDFASLYLPDGTITTIGEVKIGDTIWSSEGATKVVNKVSSGSKPVYRYKTSSGVFTGTKDHRILQGGKKIEVQYADKIDHGLPVPVEDICSFNSNSVLKGLLVGDGTFRNGSNQLCVGEKDQDYYTSEISHLIDKDGYSFFRKCENVIDFKLPPTVDRFVPDEILKGSAEDKLSFLRGLYSANGSVRNAENYKVSGIVLKQSSETLIRQCQEMLFSLGIGSKVHKQKGKAVKFKNGEYLCKDSFHLGIYACEDVKLFAEKIGFIQDYKNASIIVPEDFISKRRKSFDIIEVEYIGEHEVFHIEVDNESHTYNTGGLDVSNCVLSSMNLAKYDEWRDTDAVFVATVFLDCVAQEFIEKAKKIGGLEKAIRFTEKGRALGLGVMGWHTYLQQKSIAFESFEAHNLNQVIFKNIQEESKAASAWMGKEFGEPEWCKGTGMRNTHTMAIAPTMSTALIMGGVSQGIEPVIGNAFIQNTSAGEIERVNPCFLKIARERGKYNKELIKDVAANYGSVQHLPWLSDHEKLVLRTAFEINQEVIIRQASQRQKYIDQGQSLNLFFSADESEAEVARIHKIAFLDPMIKSLYYVRTQAGVAGSKGECVACEG